MVKFPRKRLLPKIILIWNFSGRWPDPSRRHSRRCVFYQTQAWTGNVRPSICRESWIKKVEHCSRDTLRMKISVLNRITNGRHFCPLVAEGEIQNWKYIAMGRAGPDLEQLRRQTVNRLFKPVTVLQIVMQVLSVLCYFSDIYDSNCRASKYYISPDMYIGILNHQIWRRTWRRSHQNHRLRFSQGSGNGRQIPKSSKAPRTSVRFLGTYRYAPLRAHDEIEQGYGDDMWVPLSGEFWRDHLSK